jgi:hypothetical protein
MILSSILSLGFTTVATNVQSLLFAKLLRHGDYPLTLVVAESNENMDALDSIFCGGGHREEARC